MTNMSQELLLGQPINPVNDIGLFFENIWLQRGQNLFAPVGLTGLPNGATDPASSINYLMNKRTLIERQAYQRPGVLLADKNLNVIGDLTLEMSLDYEELMADSGTAKYVVDWSNWMVDYITQLTAIEEDLHLIIEPFPDRPSWRNRWGGKIHTINIARNPDGTNTVEIQAVSNREHAKRLLLAANPIFAPEVQLPRMWILPGPMRSIMFISGFINLARLFVPGLSFVTNIFNPVSWLNPLNADSLFQVNPLAWPIQFAFVNPALDTSRWTVLGATWMTWHDATVDLLKDSGCMLRAYTWLTTDKDSPYGELVNLIDAVPDFANELASIDQGFAAQLMQNTEAVVRPTRNCVIFACEDKSGQTGPTGTPIDGLLNVIGVTLDDLVTSTLINSQTGLTLAGEPLFDLQGNEFPIVESLLGVAPAPPNVIWRESQFSAQLQSNVFMNKGSPKVIMTGGKSPTLVNETQTFAIKYGLAQLQDVLMLAVGSSYQTMTPNNFAYQQIGTVGLQNLYQNQLDNVLFAWERLTDPLVAVWGGDLDFQEFFDRGSGVAYTVSTILALQTALWKARSFYGFKTTVLNGYPWTVNVDVLLGDGAGFEFNGVIYVDQIYGIGSHVDRKGSLLTNLTVGENKDKENPLARTIRALQGVYTLFGAFLGEGTIFG